MANQPYIRPAATEALPGDLTEQQFIQSVLAGITGLPGTLVRPKWQANPPKEPPSIEVNWLAFGIDISSPDANGYLWANQDEDEVVDSVTADYQRHEALDIGVSLYGPEALKFYRLLRDGFQIPQNRDALNRANMGFVEILPARRIPELVNERWYNRVETSVILRREIIRTYAIPSLVSAAGTIKAPLAGDDNHSLEWDTENVEN